jgi:molybdopterin adenylyltransferase
MFNIGIITISDGVWRKERPDDSSQAIRQSLPAEEFSVVKYEVVPDEAKAISAKLIEWADEGSVDVIVTTGGTGLAPRDVTPEATLAVLDKVVPGLTEATRVQTFAQTPFSTLSRAVAGIRKKCLIINLPGSPKAVRECLEVVLPAIPHALQVLKGEITQHTTGKD